LVLFFSFLHFRTLHLSVRRVDSGSVNALTKDIPVNFSPPLQQHN